MSVNHKPRGFIVIGGGVVAAIGLLRLLTGSSVAGSLVTIIFGVAFLIAGAMRALPAFAPVLRVRSEHSQLRMYVVASVGFMAFGAGIAAVGISKDGLNEFAGVVIGVCNFIIGVGILVSWARTNRT